MVFCQTELLASFILVALRDGKMGWFRVVGAQTRDGTLPASKKCDPVFLASFILPERGKKPGFFLQFGNLPVLEKSRVSCHPIFSSCTQQGGSHFSVCSSARQKHALDVFYRGTSRACFRRSRTAERRNCKLKCEPINENAVFISVKIRFFPWPSAS